MYSKSAVSTDWLQWTRAQITLFFSVIHSMSKFFTTMNFHGTFSFGIITKA